MAQGNLTGSAKALLTRKNKKSKYFEAREEPDSIPPGTLLEPKEPLAEKVRITVFDYTPESFTEFECQTIEECAKYQETESVTWINIDGVGDVDILEKLGKIFNIHPLALEDIQDVEQRSKLEKYDDYLLILVKLLDFDKLMMDEQVSILLGKKYVISIQEKRGDCFDGLRDRIRTKKGHVRTLGADYLAYAMLDVITDELFPIMEDFGERLERIEANIVKNPQPKQLQWILQTKRDLLLLRRSVWPHMEIVSKLKDEEYQNIQPSTKRYLRDCHDHTFQIIDMAETYRDVNSGLQDLYMSSISNRMNEVMKVLTIIATIFIPLSFVTGLYGMNFTNMPEIDWQWGYPFAWAVMIGMVIVMFIYFKRKNWI